MYTWWFLAFSTFVFYGRTYVVQNTGETGETGEIEST